MDVDAARRLLGLDADVSREALSTVVSERSAALEARIASAPTDALRSKFSRQLDDLREAQAVLMGRDDGDADLPVARPQSAPVAAATVSPDDPRLALGEQIWAGGGAVASFATLFPDGERRVVCLPGSGADEPRLATLAAAWQSDEPLDFTAGVVGGRNYVSFRADGGMTLRNEIDAARKVRRLPEPRMAAVAVAQLARSLAAAGDGLRPRELTPDSVWRTAGGRLVPLALVAAGGLASGVDQAALGRLLWEWLSGQPMGEGSDLRAVRPDAPPHVAKAVARAVSPGGRRFPDLNSLAAVLEGSDQRIRLPGPLGVWLPEMDRRRLLFGGLCAAAALAVGLSYPAWKSAAPWRGLNSGAEAARLAGVVKVMSQRAETQLAKARSDADRAEQDALRLQERLEGANSSSDYDEILPRFVEADLEKTRVAARRDALQARAATDLEGAQVRLAEAEALLSAGDTRGALERFKILEADYRRLAAMDGELRQAASKAEAAAASRLAGAWSDGDCKTASQWTFADGKLSVSWPGQGVYRERLIGADGSTIFTIGEAPEAQAGRAFRYRLEGDELAAEEMGASPTRMRLKRC